MGLMKLFNAWGDGSAGRHIIPRSLQSIEKSMSPPVVLKTESVAQPFSTKTKDKPQRLTLAEPDQMRIHIPKIYEALRIIEELSPMGNRLVEWARQARVEFSEKAMSGMFGYFKTAHQRRRFLVVMNIENSVGQNINMVSHELMHGLQRAFMGNDNYLWNSNMRTQAIHSLAEEAGAETMAIRIAYEAKLNGEDKGFLAPPSKKYIGLFELYDSTYQEIFLRTSDADVATKRACDETFHGYFKSQDLRDSYNQNMLSYYAGRAVGYFPRRPSVGLSAVFAKAAVQINALNSEYLVDSPQLPMTDAEIFGSNILLRQACDYVEAIMVKRADGFFARSVITANENEALRADNNPFLGINLKKAVRAHAKAEKEGQKSDVFEIMKHLVMG